MPSDNRLIEDLVSVEELLRRLPCSATRLEDCIREGALRCYGTAAGALYVSWADARRALLEPVTGSRAVDCLRRVFVAAKRAAENELELPVADAARLLGCSAIMLQRWCNQKQVPALSLSRPNARRRRWQVRIADVRIFLERRARGAADDATVYDAIRDRMDR